MGLERSTFRWRPQYRTSMDGGHLVPVWARMGLPGDTFRGSRATVVRAQPLLNPVMHNAEICEYTFGVAVRTLFDNEKDWDDFITGGKDGLDDKVLPYQLSPKGGWESFSLYDYLGHRINVPNIYTNTLKARAYYKVYNDWIRNIEFQDEIEYGTNFGLDTATGTVLVRLNHIRDYFRGAMPDTQRGPEVVIPILGDAPVVTKLSKDSTNTKMPVWNAPTSQWVNGINQYNGSPGGSVTMTSTNTTQGMGTPLVADMAEVAGVAVEALRLAITMKVDAEASMRGGATRYVEWLLTYYGVRGYDDRLQRAEYIHGHSFPMFFTEIPQTSSSDETTPQGNLAGHGVAGGKSFWQAKPAKEMMIYMTLAAVRHRPAYQQGVHREDMLKTRWDIPKPVYAKLGEEAIFKGEIYAQGGEVDFEAFGYTPRFESWRRSYDSITGEFRTEYGDSPIPGTKSLDSWHMADYYDAMPTLASEFLEVHTPTRILATPKAKPFLYYSVADIKVSRLLPKQGVPGWLNDGAVTV